MQDALDDVFWSELCFGTAFLAAGAATTEPEAIARP
jgi:hypothetical protein